MGVEAALIGGGLGLAGSYLSGQSAENAANTAANAQLRAGRMAASAGAFRPVGMTNRFGSSQFTMGADRYGNPIVTGASYEASPEIQALQDRLAAMYGSSLGQAEQAAAMQPQISEAAQGLFGLGQQYMATSPEEARQKYYDQQQALLEPSRQQQEQRLASSVFGKGRAGLNISGIGSPELYSLAQAREQQNAQIAADAERAAQQQITFGQGLLGGGLNLQNAGYGLQSAALSPFQTQFGLTQALEQAALQPFELGAALGGRNVNTAGASALLQSGMGAAQTQLQGSLVGPSLMANNLSSFGNQYMQNQRQQDFFNQLNQQQTLNRNIGYYGFDPFSNTSPYALQSQAGMFGSN